MQIINGLIVWCDRNDIPPARICSVCEILISKGSYPATHTYCDNCAEKTRKEIEDYEPES